MKYSWNRKNKVLLLENIEVYIVSGLNLHDALKIAERSFPRKQRVSITRVANTVECGGTLSQGLHVHIGLSTTLSSLIEHGEYSGTLPQALSIARSIIEREESLIKSCLSALAYPIVIGLFACALTIGLIEGVMPQIIPMLKSLNVSLPLITKIVIYLTEHMMDYGLMTLLVFMVLFIFMIVIYKRIHIFRSWIHNFIAYIPIVSRLFESYNISITIRSLGGLISSGARLTDAYDKVIEKIWFIPIKQFFYVKQNDVYRGVSLSNVLFGISRSFPYIHPLVSAGEASGTLGQSLIRIADTVDRDIEHFLKKLTSLVEPLMMIIIGCVVGGIALSIMMPIYEISKVLQH